MSETRVRVAETADAPAFAAIYAPIVRDTVISFETEPPTPEEMAGRIARTLADYPWLTAVRDGQVAGYAYASQHRSRAAYRWSVDVTVYVAETARRCGVGQCSLRRPERHPAAPGVSRRLRRHRPAERRQRRSA